jgi:hypothetical protein
MIGPEHESPRPAEGEGFGDAVTFAFGDAAQSLYGSARLGLVPGDPLLASGLGLLFRDGEIAAIDAAGAIELPDADWTRIEAGDVSAEIVEPLKAWNVVYDGDDGGFELRFDALAEPAEVGRGAVAESAAGLRGYEQLCRVTGTVRVGVRRWTVDCLGQRGHQWGAPDWDRLDLARTIALWFDGGKGVALAAVRPRGAAGHDAEAVTAFLLEEEGVTPIADPRLTTVVDGDGCQRRAGLELWMTDEDDDELPFRIAGEAVCGTTLDLGRLRLDCAFFAWRMDGHAGVGRYDVLRRA